MKSIVIAAGGTGGHLYPAIAVADEIRSINPDIRIVFIGTSNRIESREVPRLGYEFYPIEIAAPGKSIGKLIPFPFMYMNAVRQSLKVLREVTPSAFMGGGAYLSLPVAQAARMRKIPSALLEINAVVGRANKILARGVDKVFLAYPESKNDFDPSLQRKIEITGTPVRPTLSANTISQADARIQFHLDPERRTLLVFGGSLGARSLNEVMRTSVTRFLEAGLNVIWQTGPSADFDQLKSVFSENANLALLPYINDMGGAYAAADLVVSRSGASTLAELATLGKPAILVPYPLAIKNHQEYNARAFELSDAAVMLLDKELPAKFEHMVLDLVFNETKLRAMQEKIVQRENKDARKVVARWLLSHCR
jgi:UDP-N-acetylglucosamine--N-acetylmuramyl-(pentapeptide) pyrophosphoryl-undecaprenol N-acetylglucosamine transferase